MARRKGGDKVEELRLKREQLQAQLAATEAAFKAEERKRDTRRKVVAGARALEHMEQNPDSEFARVMRRLILTIERPNDRAAFPEFFGEAPEESPSTEANGSTPEATQVSPPDAEASAA